MGIYRLQYKAIPGDPFASKSTGASQRSRATKQPCIITAACQSPPFSRNRIPAMDSQIQRLADGPLLIKDMDAYRLRTHIETGVSNFHELCTSSDPSALSHDKLIDIYWTANMLGKAMNKYIDSYTGRPDWWKTAIAKFEACQQTHVWAEVHQTVFDDKGNVRLDDDGEPVTAATDEQTKEMEKYGLTPSTLSGSVTAETSVASLAPTASTSNGWRDKFRSLRGK